VPTQRGPIESEREKSFYPNKLPMPVSTDLAEKKNPQRKGQTDLG
jgi:hypothetical protein